VFERCVPLRPGTPGGEFSKKDLPVEHGPRLPQSYINTAEMPPAPVHGGCVPSCEKEKRFR